MKKYVYRRLGALGAATHYADQFGTPQDFEYLGQRDPADIEGLDRVYGFTCIRTVAFSCDCDAAGYTDPQTMLAEFMRRIDGWTSSPEELEQAAGQDCTDVCDENGLGPTREEAHAAAVSHGWESPHE